MTTREPRADRGSVLPIVLAALVLSALTVASVADRVQVVLADATQRREVMSRRAAVEGAVRAALSVGACAPSRWPIGDLTVDVTCTADQTIHREVYSARANDSTESTEVTVTRDETGRLLTATWTIRSGG